MPGRGYEGWYERIRDSDKVSVDDITEASAQDVLKQFQEYEPKSKQKEMIREQQVEEDIEDVNERNTVSTDRQTSIPEERARRPSKSDETIVSIKGDIPDISADAIGGSYKHQGNKVVRVDGEIYGVVDE